MKKILYVDACVNRESSRTERLAGALLERLEADGNQIEHLILEDAADLLPLDGAAVLERTEGTEASDFSGRLFRYAKQFAAADEVVFAAPYWDLSFPAKFKVYLEHLCAQGVTFRYSEKGIPTGLVDVKRVYFITTAGGYTGDWDYGWIQVRDLCKLYFGIEDVRRFSAEGLDIITNDADAIMEEALVEIRSANIS